MEFQTSSFVQNLIFFSLKKEKKKKKSRLVSLHQLLESSSHRVINSLKVSTSIKSSMCRVQNTISKLHKTRAIINAHSDYVNQGPCFTLFWGKNIYIYIILATKSLWISSNKRKRKRKSKNKNKKKSLWISKSTPFQIHQ